MNDTPYEAPRVTNVEALQAEMTGDFWCKISPDVCADPGYGS